MKLYQWCDLASATIDAYLAYRVVRMDVSGCGQRMTHVFSAVFRLHLLLKLPLHLVILPFYSVGGSISNVRVLMSPNKTYEMLIPKEASDDNRSKDKLVRALHAKAMLLGNRKEKTNVFCKAFGLIFFTALLLTLDHHIYRILDITLMSLWVSVASFAALVHFIYFPNKFTSGKQEAEEIIHHPRIGHLAVIYTILLVGGWTFGNYLALLDWNEPIIYFPNANYIGICFGHFIAAVFGTICISV